MNKPMIVLKLGGEILGVTASALTGLLAVGESTALTSGAIVAVLGFAGLLVRQVTSNQKLYIGIVASKDHDLAERDETIRYLRWELESMRYRHGERQVDPGPYVPRVTLPTTSPVIPGAQP